MILKLKQDHISFEFWQNLLNIIWCPTCIVLDIGALDIEIRENDDLFFVKLAHLFRDDHIVVRIVIVELNDEVISAKVVGDFPLQRSASESSPENLLPFHHSLVRLGDTSIEVQISPLLCVGFELSGKLLLVVLFKLLLDNSDDGRNFLVFAFSEQLVHFFVSVVSSVEIYEAF